MAVQGSSRTAAPNQLMRWDALEHPEPRHHHSITVVQSRPDNWRQRDRTATVMPESVQPTILSSDLAVDVTAKCQPSTPGIPIVANPNRLPQAPPPPDRQALAGAVWN